MVYMICIKKHITDIIRCLSFMSGLSSCSVNRFIYTIFFFSRFHIHKYMILVFLSGTFLKGIFNGDNFAHITDVI